MAQPIANDDLTYAVDEDAILRVNQASGVLSNDTDADGDTLAARISDFPENPLFDFKTNGSFVYDARYHGALWLTGDVLSPSDGGDADLPDGFNSLAEGAVVYDEYQYLADDGVDEDGALVRVAITGVNDDPVAVDDVGTFQQGTDTQILVDALGNDTDVDVWPEPDTLSITGLADIADEGGPAGGTDTDDSDGLSITTAEGGTVTLVGGQIQYEAAPGFFGIDTFEYTASDQFGGSDTGLVRITVLPTNVAPDAVDDSYQISEDAGATAFASVLGNDTDADDSPLIAATLNGTLATALTPNLGLLVDFNSDGTFTYDPNGEFESLGVGDSAFITFDYTAYDGEGLTDVATVTLEVQGENDNPTGESPDNVLVYEAGLANGSGDGPTTITQDIDIVIDDVDASDIPFVAGTTGGDKTTLVGLYGTLSFLDNDTVRYTLTSNAMHDDIQGHNGGIFDSFTVYVVDEHGGFSDPLTVTAEVIDDINFLVDLPNGAGQGNDLDNTSVAYSTNATTQDPFTLIPGADGQSLDVVGIPDVFTLVDGRTVTSSIYLDGDGEEAVQGMDSNGDLFYQLTFDPDFGLNLGQYTLTMFQDPPIVINEIDFSSISAGGPQEKPFVENIGFDGGFFDFGADNVFQTSDIFLEFTNSPTNSDDINPNNAGGIGIGNGNIERFEALAIDVTQSLADVSGVRFVMDGVGGGVPGSLDVLWVAVDNGAIVATGSETTTNINAAKSVTLGDGTVVDGEFVFVEPGVEFDQLYVALDPNDVDDNDKVRINNIATLEEEKPDTVELTFRVNSDDTDGDHSPIDPGYEEFIVTLLGESGDTLTPDVVIA